MTIILHIRHLFLQSAQGGGGGLLLIIFLVLVGIVFYVEKRKTRNETQIENAKSQGNFSLNTIVSYISRNKKPLTIGLIIVLCVTCIPLEISRVEDLQEDAYQEGYENGKKEGYKRGYDEGYSQGENDGLSSGQRSGYSRGYNDAQIRTTTCMSCNGRGVKVCFHCNGAGCGMCGNTGVEKCNMCNGRGWNQY